MKSTIFNVLLVLTATYLLIVRAQQQECKCGDLGSGTNPCSCSETVVKAAELPKPTYYVSAEKINAAAAARNGIISYQLSGSPQIGCPNSPNRSGSSSSSSAIYSNSNTHIYTGSNLNSYSSESDSSAYSGSNSNANSDSNIIQYSDSSSNSYGSGDSIGYSSNSPNVYSNSNSNAYGDEVPAIDAHSNRDSGCGCNNKQVVESSEPRDVDVSINSDENIVPRFPPIGDLCSPLPSLRSEKLVERTKVTPAYPGKIVCNSCNKVPYELCVNAVTGETTSRTIVPNSVDAISGFNSLTYGKPNLGVFSGSVSGTYPTIRRTGATVDFTPGLRSHGNFNSRLSSISKFRTYGNSNFGSFSRSSVGIHDLPSLIYANANTNTNTAIGQRQYAKVPTSDSFSTCDDDTDETLIDYSYPEMPADAVSLTLAYKNLRAPNVIYRQGKQFVPEDKLSFGHRTVPNDVKNGRKILEIPEEKLVTVEKPVVELKIAPPRTIVVGSYDEQEEAKLAELEAIERESITQEETADEMAESLISYKDLGYAPVGSTLVKSHSYDGTVKGEINDSSEEPCGPLGPPIPDYVPGSVVVQRDVMDS
ncbi:uncharacterized protein LOC143180911 [Calliopsis andreniformis]|uniref:uncharacterized protein LOC143180911 n=1 Tax=Calliopsis andreniformis TaxID=337506 RepID=UPI003FCDD825